jgi:hypothetical protein
MWIRCRCCNLPRCGGEQLPIARSPPIRQAAQVHHCGNDSALGLGVHSVNDAIREVMQPISAVGRIKPSPGIWICENAIYPKPKFVQKLQSQNQLSILVEIKSRSQIGFRFVEDRRFHGRALLLRRSITSSIGLPFGLAASRRRISVSHASSTALLSWFEMLRRISSAKVSRSAGSSSNAAFLICSRVIGVVLTLSARSRPARP